LLNHIIMSHLACLKIALFKVRKVWNAYFDFIDNVAEL
jgi:hypothetical protein